MTQEAETRKTCLSPKGDAQWGWKMPSSRERRGIE